MPDHLLVIDQGTTSTRAVVYDSKLQPVGQGQAEVLPTYPRSGWVEHDPDALIASVGSQVTLALLDAGRQGGPDRGHRPDESAGNHHRLGASARAGRSPRPWSGRTGGPPTSASGCTTSRAWISKRTGLVIDPYFSATKIAWILDHVPGARPRAIGGELAAGTVDTLLDLASHRRPRTSHRRHERLANPPDGPRNGAVRPMSSVRSSTFRPEYCPRSAPARAISGARRACDYLPDGIPITGVAGDQQASLVGQGCVEPGPGEVHLRHGSVPAGPHRRTTRPLRGRGLITTRAASLGDGPAPVRPRGQRLHRRRGGAVVPRRARRPSARPRRSATWHSRPTRTAR